MTQFEVGDSEIVRRGQQLFEDEIRPRLEPGHEGKYLVINVESGEFEMDADVLAASKRARARFPRAPLYTVRIGYPTAYRLGKGGLERQTA